MAGAPPQTYALTSLLSGNSESVSYQVSAVAVDHHCREAYPVRDNLEPLIDDFMYNPKQTACALGAFGAYRAIAVAKLNKVSPRGFNAETFCDLSMGGFLNEDYGTPVAGAGATAAAFSVKAASQLTALGVSSVPILGPFGLNVDLVNADNKEFTWTAGAVVGVDGNSQVSSAAVHGTATSVPSYGVFGLAGMNTMGEVLVDSMVDDPELEAACQEGFETFRHWVCSSISGATYPRYPSGAAGDNVAVNQEQWVQALVCQDGSNTGTGGSNGYNFGSKMAKASKKKGKKASGSSSSVAGFAAVGVGSAVVTAVGMKLLTGKKNAAPKATIAV